MFRNLLLNLVSAPLFLPLLFAYVAAVVVATVGILRSFAAGQKRGAEGTTMNKPAEPAGSRKLTAATSSGTPMD